MYVPLHKLVGVHKQRTGTTYVIWNVQPFLNLNDNIVVYQFLDPRTFFQFSQNQSWFWPFNLNLVFTRQQGIMGLETSISRTSKKILDKNKP